MWSPDGTRIAFVDSTPTGAWFLSIMDADGSHPLRLATSSKTRPAWSPDGTKIVFSRKDGDNWDIYLVGADGTGLTNLTNSPSADLDPVWSPDGSQIAFSSDRSGDLEIYVVRVDGAGLVRLTHNPGSDEQPQWSPDGSRIAFLRSWMPAGIYVIGPTGSNEVQITTGGGNPRWSPDGARIAFVMRGGFLGCGEWGCYGIPTEVKVVAVDGGGGGTLLSFCDLLNFCSGEPVTEIEWSPRR
jgi:TolB protein